jgi:hypothetical protein
VGGTLDPNTGESLQVELSETRTDRVATPPHPPRSPLDPRYAPRQRMLRLVGVTGAVVLAVAVVMSSIPGVRDHTIALFAGPTPSPTLLAVPGSDQFYLLPNPPGVTVSLDGHALAALPAPGDPHPLRLARGHHVFAWSSRLLPFTPLRCTVSSPLARSDTCPFVEPQYLAVGGVPFIGHVIASHESLAALPPSDNAQLTQAIQDALAASGSRAVVRTGEHYFFYQQGQHQQPLSGRAVVATQPLNAQLSYQLVTNPSDREPCVRFLFDLGIPCRFLGQDCTQLCTVAQPPAAVAGAADAWVVAATVSASWAYTALDGQVVAQNIQEASGIQLAFLRITWDNAGWHVTPLFGHIPGFPGTDDVACDPARYWLSNSTWSFMLTNPPPGSTAQFASDATPTDGCIVVLDQQRGDGSPAVFLERFGVLLTVNDVAVNPVDNFPVADAGERQLAAQLEALLAGG